MSTDKDVARAYSAFKRPKPCLGVRMTLEDGVPVFHVPKAVSGSEMVKDERLKRPRIQGGWKVGF